MSFIVGILTFLLIVNCLLLILLVLIQLPKKDAGAGLAFGGGAADALFGTGSGNALTKITKYATVIFFAMSILLGYLEERTHSAGNASEFQKQVQQKQMQTPVETPPVTSQPQSPTSRLLALPLTSDTNAPVVAPTNAPTK